MDIDTTKWLKDHLGLVQMSEADLNYFMFNPRHGTLCRRFIKFLVESTLCGRKYPHAFVEEENLEAKQELVRTNAELRDTISNLDVYIKTQENDERELSFLKLKSNYLHMIEDLKKTSTEALENIADRQNYVLDQVSQNIDECSYSSDPNVGNIYAHIIHPNADSKLATMGPISRAQMSHIDDRLDKLVNKTNTMHTAISKLYEHVNSEMDNIGRNLEVKKTSLQNLVGLKPPKFEEVELNVGLDEKKLKVVNSDLVDKICKLNQQVLKLNDLYDSKISEIYTVQKEKIRELSDIMNNLHEVEVSIEKMDLGN